MGALALAFVAGGAGVLLAGGLIVEHYHKVARQQAALAARQLQLRLGSRHWKLSSVLSGTVDGHRVVATVGALSLRVEVFGLAALDRLAFTATRSTPERERARPERWRDVEVGDAAVDDHWALDGSHEGVVRALFSRPEVQRYLQVWRRLSLTPDGTLTLQRIPEPGPDVTAEVHQALALASLLLALADVEPVDAPHAVRALLEARGLGGASGAPAPVPSLAPPRKRRLFSRTR